MGPGLIRKSLMTQELAMLRVVSMDKKKKKKKKKRFLTTNFFGSEQKETFEGETGAYK